MGDMEPTSTVGGACRSALFRREAVDFVKSRRYGSVILTNSKSLQRTVAIVCFLVLSMLVTLMSLPTTRKAPSMGVLLPKAGIVRITSGGHGVISEMRVKEGQLVVAGSILFVVSRAQNSENPEAPEVLVSRLLEQRRSSLQVEQRLADEQSRQRLNAAQRRVRELTVELKQAGRQLELQRSRAALARNVFARYLKLKDQGFVSELQTAEKQAELLDQQQRLEELTRAQASRERERAEALAAADDLALKVQQDAETLRRNFGVLEQEIAQHAGQREAVIRAPISGIVSVNEATQGQRVAPESVVVTLLPTSTELEAELYVPSQSIGFIQKGTTVMLRYRAYPYQKFGQHRATVREIAAMSSRKADDAMTSTPGAEPTYRVRLTLDQQAIRAYGNSMPLKPGMIMDASIVLDERRLYEWILEPLYSISGRS